MPRTDRTTTRGGALPRLTAALLACVALASRSLLAASAPAQAQDAAIRCSSSTAPRTTTTAPGVEAIEALGAANGFDGRRDRPTPRRSPATSSRSTARSSSSTPPATCSTPSRRPPCSAFVEAGGGFLAIGSAAQGEPGTDVLRRPDRRAARRRQPDRRVPSRPSSSATACTRRRASSRSSSTRTDAWYEWQTAPDRARVHTRRALPRARRRRPATARTSAAPTSRSRGAATSRAAAPSTPAWAAPRQPTARRSSATHLLGALQWTAGLRARRLQGDDQRQLHAAPSS